ncbi:hypothetical protein [Massilia glaciei]|uniref:Uncharacterized protein n=1 Tax=Massilia glaciei TaxID=1524097 RepID=A0A2U2I4J0_9BURK|nr:hypothetical protein [Massilia glaciei]PWF54653.1 hypothetical protein C7C56_005895 [Massilia glaciei]
MPPLHTGADKARYLVRAVGDAVSLAEFLNIVRVDPEVDIVSEIGPKHAPHTVVLEMSSAKARALEEGFSKSHQLMIEPDRPLSLFD